MMTLDQLTEFFGWLAILNMAMLGFASSLIVFFKSPLTAVHSKILAIPEQDLTQLYFNYLANYKILTFVFSVMPYIALKIIN